MQLVTVQKKVSISDVPSECCQDADCGCHEVPVDKCVCEEWDHGHQFSYSYLNQVVGSSSWFCIPEDHISLKVLHAKLTVADRLLQKKAWVNETFSVTK